jgi:predicted component of type VI protein secretion system
VIASAVVPEKAAPVPGPRPGAILEIRLAAEGHDLAVSEPGAHELGRSADAPLRVNHPTVSRKHARIILADDRGIAYLQDAGGANGTRLNGKAVEKLAPLSDGDHVGIGEVELKVTLKRV